MNERVATERGLIEGLPHRAPFRFLTRVDSLDAGREGRGAWEITGREEFFAGHFPGRPVVPGVLIAEALAQLAGLVGLAGSADGRLAHVDLRFDGAVAPPAEILLYAAVARRMGALSLFEVRAESAGSAVARGMLTLADVGGGAGGGG